MTRLAAALGLALILVPAHGGAATDQEQRAARWKDIRTDAFGTRTVQATDTLIKLDAPDRALDAAFVPVTLTMPDKDKVAAVYLFIDDNPSPNAARFTFGPAADPAQIKLRVRVDSYTNIHAVVETKDGGLFETSRFIKAAGGCSAPIGVSDEEASRGMGEMRLRYTAETKQSHPTVEATLMIRHPNFNGMQMNPFTKGYTPARYLKEVDVSSGGKRIFKLDGDISLSADPVITFRYAPQAGQPVRVAALDSQNGRWEQSFDAPAAP